MILTADFKLNNTNHNITLKKKQFNGKPKKGYYRKLTRIKITK